MRAKVGLWIDQKKAVVVSLKEKGEEIGVINSEVEKQARRTGDSPLKGSYDSHQVPADDSRQRALTGHLHIYYDKVIESIRDAESILIFGPGTTKSELKERLEENNLGERVVGIETSDKMTDPEIAAKVRKHYAK
ncbi:MAG: hypothetical protein HQM08_07570 [Candidatus Riflebacteria bacterium]|nr:hypothetical protein [Candidatus Riflebacteria bacterium]